MSSQIERELISDKPSCYIFDIDGCLADIDHILVTKKEGYELAMNEYKDKQAKYDRDLAIYKINKEKYKNGEIKMLGNEPIPPIAPMPPLTDQLNKLDWPYLVNHYKDAHVVNGVLDLFIALAKSKQVIILTGRPESTRLVTSNWLNDAITKREDQNLFRRINFKMIFRPDKNQDPAMKFKKETILNLAKTYNIQLIIEDDPKVVAEYTKLGFLVLSPNREYKEIK